MLVHKYPNFIIEGHGTRKRVCVYGKFKSLGYIPFLIIKLVRYANHVLFIFLTFFLSVIDRSFSLLTICFFFAIRFTTNYLVTVTNVSLDQRDKRSVINIRDLSVAMDLHSSQTSTSAVLATRELVSRVLLKVLMNAVNLSVIDFSRFYFSRVMISRRMIVL
jgi:hypothetical protein